MFYKVIKNGKVIDVLDKLVYLKYQPKYDRMPNMVMMKKCMTDAQIEG